MLLGDIVDVILVMFTRVKLLSGMDAPALGMEEQSGAQRVEVIRPEDGGLGGGVQSDWRGDPAATTFEPGA
eukprot:scaffold6802_cov341-Ochromonas_danica.AAC.1